MSTGESPWNLVLDRDLVVVHGYDDVDLGVVRDIVENRLVDLLDFGEAIKARLANR